tara:strand:+ start:23612 stop:32341 length:8730 start_codon:yes stop_codon:yes gene_type:complete
MPEYKFGDTFFTEDDVKQRAAEKGLTIDDYLTQNPEVTKVEEGKQNGTAQTGTTTVPDMVSKSENGSSEPPVAPVNNRTDWIKPNFFDLQEEEAVSQLQVRYPEFEFKQSGRFFPFDEANKSDHRKEQRLGLANYVEVTAPNGEKLLLETAISQALPKVIASKGKDYDVKGYYQDQLQDLTNFIEVNATAKKDKLTEAKSRRRSLYLGFAEATGVTPEELEGINDEFPDISIFDTQTSKDFTGYIPVRDRVPGLPEYKDVITQPYEDILKQAAVELKTEGNITQGDEESIKERALQILKNNAEKAKREEKGKQYLETLEGGEVPKVLQEDFLRFVKEGEKLNMNNLKPYITVGAKEYREDLSLAMLNTVDARVKVENSQTELQNIINKKVYTEEDKVRYDELFKGYEANYDNYNNSVEELNGFTMSVDDQRAQLNMLQKNYNDWDKQGASLLLNFRDFAAKAAYGTSALVGADGDLPDEKDPTRTREEVRTQELVDVLNQSQIIRSGYGDDVSFDKAFDSVSNFTKWTVSMGNSQLPILASLATPGGWSALLTSSFGENYKEMTYEQMKTKASSELLGFNYKDPRNFEENSRFNKWAFSMMFAAPEVLLDRATTGMRVRGIKEMFKSGKDELIDKNLKEVMSELAFGLPQDATLGAMSEGTTQLWQNFLTGKKDIWEGVDEAAFSGLLMDGVLSSVPTLKAAVFTQMSDPQKIKDIQADRKKLDDLYAIRENALKFQPKIGGNLDSQIKELEQKIETKIKENVDSIIGIGSRGLTATAVDAYVKATGYKARLKNQAQSILNDNLTPDSRKQELLKDLHLQYEAVKNYQNELISEKGSEFALWSQDSKNKASLDVFVREAKAKLAKDGKTDPTDLEIQEVTRVLYNTEKILQEETAVKKAKLDKDVDLNETITYAKTEEEFDNWVNEVIQPKIDALKSKETLTNKDVKEISNLEESKKAYKEGSYGFNVDGKSIAIVENMAKDDRLEIRTHELGHELGARAFKNNPAIFNGMAKTILDWAKVNDVGLFNRLERITERKNDQLIADEVMAVFFEEVAANRVNLKSEKNRGLLSIFGFGTNKAMKDNYGIDFELAGVDDTFELVYGIAKKISKGTITKADIDKLSGSKAVEALKIKGEQIVNQYLFQTENIVKKASKVQEKIDALPDMYNLEDWQKEGADDAIVQSYQDLQGMIANKAFMLDKLPNFSKEDFIDETLMRLMEHMRRFNPWKKEFRNGNPNPIFKALVDQGVKESDIPKLTWAEVKNKLGSEVVGKYGFSGWINSQLMNKIGDVLKSKTATTDTFSVDETADTFKEIVETRDDYEILEEEDLSLQAQLRKKQREKRLAEQGMEADVEYSKFRRELMFGDNKGIDAKMKQVIEGVTLNILASPKYIDLDLSKVETELQRDYEVAIKKVVQDAIGGGQGYVDFLIKNKRTILRHIDISSLVAIERQVKPEDKIMTKFVRRLQTKKDIQDAIDNGWLSHIDNPAQGPSLYKVLDPSVSDFVKFYDLPRYVESAKKVKQWDSLGLETQQEIAKQTGKTLEAVRKEYVQTRSGLKGTRKDTLAERISNQLAFDATMQVLQSPEFAQKRAEAGKPVVAQAKIKEIARRIDRGLDVKFAKKSVPQFAASMASDLITDASKRNSLKINNKLINASKYKLYDTDLKQLAVDIAEHILKDSRNTTILSAINKITDRPVVKDIIKEESLEAEQAKLSETQDVNDAVDGFDTDAYLSIRYSKKRRDEYIRRLKNKRPEVSSRAESLVDEVFKFVDSDLIPKNKKVKFEKLSFHYVVNGYVILPEDGYKIIQAEMLASKNKIDPFSVGNPNELIERYAETVKVKDEKTDPDKVKELSNKKIVEGAVSGVTVYDVEATKAGQKAIRKICDTHWGKESNPWCVIARVVPQSIAQEMAEEFGEIVEQQEEQFDDLASSFTHWKAYNNGGNGFKVSFINGKLNSFRDGNSNEWWNRMDKPSKTIIATDNKRIDGVLNVFDVDIKTGDKVLVQKQFGENASNGLITNYTYEKIPSRSEGKPGQLTVKESMTMNRGKIDSGITKEFDYNNAPDVEKAVKIPTPEALGAKPMFDFDSIILKDLKKFEIYTDYTFTQEQNENTTEAQKIKADETGVKHRETVVGKITRADESILKEYKGKEVTIVKTRTYNKGLTLGTQTKITIDGKDIKFAKKTDVELAIEKALSGVNLEGQSQLSLELNKMVERSVGISAEETISRAISRDIGANKNKRQLYIPPSAEDFLGLMYFIVGKGKQGDADLKFIKENLTDKFSEAYTKLDTIRRSVLQDVSTLNKNFPEVQAKLKDKMPGSMFTYDQAIRVYLYNKNGYTVPGISIEETANLVARVTTDKELAVYAESFNLLSRTDKWVKPSEYWTASTITSDMNKIVEGTHRASVLSDWVENKNEIFSKDNLSKLEAAYGTNYIDALEDMLYRMETGLNRGRNHKDKTTTRFTNFLNNSVATIMFFNSKSALLQTLSTVNYINFKDNNIFAASEAFADQKQFWSDFVMIYNSDFLKGRRSGLKTDIQLSEVADAVAKASNKAQATMAYLLKIGFSPTQAADSFAISMGGATYYRNRVNKYLKEGKSQGDAESQAFIDFREVSEETQQSARPDRVSQQQTSSAGRFILAFQNAPMQFQRIIKKSTLDLASGRGDYKANISRIIYYGAVQNLIFSGMQNALFALAFDDEDEHKLLDKDLAKKKKNDDKRIARIGNSMVDTILRGSGIAGAVISTVKNVIMKFYEEKEKGPRMDKSKILIQAASLSPQVGSKLSKLNKALNTYMYEKDAIPLMSKLNTKNPIYSIGAPIIEATLNIPLDRLLTKTNNLKEALDSSNASWQRVGTALGWSAWSLGIDTRDEVKDVIKEGKEKGLIKGKSKAKPCLGVKSSGMPCGNTTTSGSFCYLHD